MSQQQLLVVLAVVAAVVGGSWRHGQLVEQYGECVVVRVEREVKGARVGEEGGVAEWIVDGRQTVREVVRQPMGEKRHQPEGKRDGRAGRQLEAVRMQWQQSEVSGCVAVDRCVVCCATLVGLVSCLCCQCDLSV